jgi:hypothetical protein
VPASSKAKVNDAIKLYESFTGHDAGFVDEVEIQWPNVAAVVGLCDGILYETVRDGEVEHYIHKFKKNARPKLIAGHDGKALGLVGGKFTFTERGIVDN